MMKLESQDKKELERLVCQDSLYEFTKRAWPIVVKGKRFIDSPHVKVICDHLQAVTEGKINRLLINIPPRHTKSLLVSVMWPAWVWTRDPSVQWLFGSRVQAVSIRDNRKSRLLIESSWYQGLFGVTLASDQNVKSFYANDEGGHRIATSAGSQGTGLDADVLVMDDLHGINDKEEQIEKNIEWCEDTFWSRGNTHDAPRVTIGQRVRANDISGHILAGYAGGGWVELVLPMEYEESRRCRTGLVTDDYPDGFEDWRTEPGELLCPDRFPQEWVDEQKKKPNRHARLNQQNPAPAEGGIIKKAWLDERFSVIKIEKAKWGTSCDSPFRKGKNTDYFVLQLIAKIGAKFHIVAQVRKRASFTDMEMTYEGFISHWESVLKRKLINNVLETKASGDAIKSKLGFKINIVPFDPGRDSKEQRFETASPVFMARNVSLPAPNAVLILGETIVAHLSDEFVEEYKEEVGTVPFADHDDQADATVQYILDDMLKASTPPKGGVAKPKKDVHTVRRPGFGSKKNRGLPGTSRIGSAR